MEIDVSHIANLAGLRFSQKEMVELARVLRSGLEPIDRLREPDVKGVPPTFWVGDAGSIPLDADSPRPGLRHEDVMTLAPDRDGAYVLVPREDAGRGPQEKKQ